MMLGKIWSFFAAIAPALSIVLGYLVLFSFLSRCSLSDELTAAKAEIDRQEAQVKALEAAITLQNQAIETLNQQTKAAEMRYEVAKSQSEAKNKKLDKTIAQMKAAKGTNCDEAMPFVNDLLNN